VIPATAEARGRAEVRAIPAFGAAGAERRSVGRRADRPRIGRGSAAGRRALEGGSAAGSPRPGGGRRPRGRIRRRATGVAGPGRTATARGPAGGGPARCRESAGDQRAVRVRG